MNRLRGSGVRHRADGLQGMVLSSTRRYRAKSCSVDRGAQGLSTPHFEISPDGLRAA